MYSPRLISLLTLFTIGTAEVTTVQIFNMYGDDCPEVCCKSKFADSEELQSCHDAVTSNSTSACLSVGSYSIKGTDKVTYGCSGADKTYKYYAAYIPALKDILGTVADATLEAKVTLTTDCTLYKAETLPVAPVENKSCQVDTTKIDTTTPYISAKAGATSVTLPIDFTGVHYLVSKATDTGCDALKDAEVTLTARVVYEIAGTSVPVVEATSQAAVEASGSDRLWAVGSLAGVVVLLH
eukprot:Blabericola_migrator_1__4195@NODE_2286_length_2996_cov_997_503926_g1436_i0_p2_GENE_NODE_2286_length_2996_cov_997_503926_g1436_i0NODE_2286_length_2996_cov_997_503926_g1436_i0_p2_ORF_typecomplete_len239_score34_47_NODE_2286_length_2996_cov_997_503926_g1436_i018732589